MARLWSVFCEQICKEWARPRLLVQCGWCWALYQPCSMSCSSQTGLWAARSSEPASLSIETYLCLAPGVCLQLWRSFLKDIKSHIERVGGAERGSKSQKWKRMVNNQYTVQRKFFLVLILVLFWKSFLFPCQVHLKVSFHWEWEFHSQVSETPASPWSLQSTTIQWWQIQISWVLQPDLLFPPVSGCTSQAYKHASEFCAEATKKVPQSWDWKSLDEWKQWSGPQRTKEPAESWRRVSPSAFGHFLCTAFAQSVSGCGDRSTEDIMGLRCIRWLLLQPVLVLLLVGEEFLLGCSPAVSNLGSLASRSHRLPPVSQRSYPWGWFYWGRVSFPSPTLYFLKRLNQR